MGVLDQGVLELRSPRSNPAISRRSRLAPAVHSHPAMRILIGLFLLAGCERDLVAALPDAAPPADAPLPDAPARYCAATPANPLAAGTTKIFLNTEGVTLTASGSGDDAAQDATTLIAMDGTVVPAFLPGVSGRETYIAQIVAAAQSALAPYSVDIVTTRPAASPYQMIVLGGSSATLEGCAACVALSHISCSPLVNAVDLVFDRGPALKPARYANVILDDISIINGLAETTAAHDCACRFDASCTQDDTVCNFGTNVPTTMMMGGTPPIVLNCGRTTQDEPMLLKDVFGCR
jgi:hypothetical protein